jgi:hypothetical protein
MDQAQLESVGRELAAAVAREIANGRSKKWRCPGELKSKIVSYSRACRERGDT